MAELVIYPASDKTSVYQVWPHPDSIPLGVIEETGSYFFELKGADNPSIAELLIDGIQQEALRPKDPTTALWKWKPGFHAGIVEASIKFNPHQTARFEFITDPDRRKLARGDYDTMVAEILEDTFALFSISSFRNKIGQGDGSAIPPIARLEFLRSRIELIQKSVIEINSKPRRTLRGSIKTLPYHQVRNVTGIEIIRSFQSGRILKDQSKNSLLPKNLKGFMPASIKKKVVHSDLDIREHREIKSALKYWSVWLHNIEAKLSKDLRDRKVSKDRESKTVRGSWIVRIQGMRRKLQSLLQLEVFAELPEEPLSIKLSSIYRNVPAYREFYSLYRDMNLGLANVIGDFLQVPLARTYDLYELWCFLRLLRAALMKSKESGGVDQLFSIDSKSNSLTVTTQSVQIPIGKGKILSFQRHYKEYWISGNESLVGSFSRTMIPDITLTHSDPDNNSIIVLDAKYRIEDGLNDALSSIHMYRDAIVQGEVDSGIKRVVKAAYLLCPRFTEDKRKGWKDTKMPGRLFHPQYRSTFKFGAIVMRPGMTDSELSEVLDTIIKDSS